MIGFDYGIKPNILVIGDVEFPGLIHEAEPIAMGYGILPFFELLHEPPFACLIFENDEKGKECFEHLKNWAEGSNDGDAVSLSFIERNEDGYVVCVYPEIERLIDRCVPKHIQNEVNPIVMSPTSFPITVESTSQHYLTFKQQTEEQPFVFFGGSKTGKMFLDLAICKRQVQFYKAGEIPKNVPENAYKYIKSSGKGRREFERQPPMDSAKDIKRRRQQRLRRFLPITIEKLAYDSNFKNSNASLMSQGFADWQVLQAACNILVSLRMCGELHFKGLDEKSANQDILMYLISNFEQPTDELQSETSLSTETLSKQIVMDTLVLLDYFEIKPKYKSKKVLLDSLKKKGLLNDNG